MTERIPCIREGCEHMILPATAAKTGGYCMPCKQEMEREAHQRYIEANRRDVNLYDGVTDDVQILKIMHTPRAYDPLIRYIPYKYSMEQLYLSLSTEQQLEMKRYAMELIHSEDEDTGKDILLYLVCYHDLPLTAEIPELLEQEIFYPAVLYKSASGETRDHLLQQVQTDGENRNHILMMLAYIGDEVAVQQFWQWKQSPPDWASELYVAPERYALQAGWELTSEGQRRELFSTPCYSLYEVRVKETGYRGDIEDKGKTEQQAALRAAKAAVEEQQQRCKQKQEAPVIKGNPVPLLVPSADHCPWCGSSFISLINIPVNHPALQTIDWNFQQLDVQTCLVCSSYSVMYMEMNESGHPIWSRYNVKPEGFDDIGVEEIRVNVSGLVSSTLDDLKELGGQGKARSQREAQELERVQGQGQGEELERVQVPVSEQIQEQDQVQVKPEDQVQHEHQVRPEVMDQQEQQHEHRHQQEQQQARVQRRLFHIAEKPRQPFHGSEWAMEPSISQIGGHPGWVQDADYPECPVCSTTMKAIGQLDGELIQEYGEGVYYMFVCEPCQMTAVSYQQS